MFQTLPASVSAIEDEAHFYLDRIRQIDKIIEEPVKTLIGLAPRQTTSDTPPQNEISFPTWISSELNPLKEDNRLSHAICCGTLQEIWRFRRRFSWLDSRSIEQLDNFHKKLVNTYKPERFANFDTCAELLKSETYGGLNPLLASQIFRVLLEAGEGSAHSGLGFLAFFAMIWPLSRAFPNRLIAGARIEPWDVTTYVTAKCLLPIRRLQGIIGRRAKLYDDIVANLLKLKDSNNGNDPRVSWLFRIELDDLCANLSHLSRLAIDENAFKNAAKSIRKEADTNNSDSQVYHYVLGSLCTALIAIRTTSNDVLKHANTIVDCLTTMIEDPLRAKEREPLAERPVEPLAPRPESLSISDIEQRLGLRFAGEYQGKKEYWADLANAAHTSIDYCREALKELEAACQICPDALTPPQGAPLNLLETNIESALEHLAHANRNVKEVLNKPVTDAALWCRNVVDREIAHASAANFTDFDPSELVSGIAVAVGWDLMSTKLQVSDAVTKAIAGARKDGSWRSGKPYYSRDHATGVWAMTSDIVWTLTSAIKQFPAVRDADQELFNFVDWLERTQIRLHLKDTKATDEHSGPQPAERHYVGWASERLRDRGKIQLATTALSINALLEIRNLAEYRLWELCKKRFTVLAVDKPLREIAPVDLGAKHSERLHRRFEWMAYDAKENYESAEYSVVLHGPPGSSKTKLAEALSAEMWKYSSKWGANESRLIRITPADFTRLGEDRLDSEARAIFDLLTGLRGVTIFFDEIDELLRQRDPDDKHPTFMQLVVPAMLNRLADLRSACPRQEICFVLATNYVDNIDSALIRKGRIDASIPVVYPDFASRVAISLGETDKSLRREQSPEQREEPPQQSARKKIVSDMLKLLVHHEEIAEKTSGWPYLAFTSLCMFLVRGLIKNENSTFKDVLEMGLDEHGSSFAAPVYAQRLKRDNQQFLNEYIHHLISKPKRSGDCKKELTEDVKNLKLDARKLTNLFDAVIAREGRGN